MPLTPGTRSATIDHLVPRMRGGSNVARDNAVPACGSCNSSKGAAIWPDEWTLETGLLVDRVGVARRPDRTRAISARALGILAIARSSGVTDVSPRALADVVAEGYDAVKTAVGELVLAGYVEPYVRTQGYSLRKVGLRMAVNPPKSLVDHVAA